MERGHALPASAKPSLRTSHDRDGARFNISQGQHGSLERPVSPTAAPLQAAAGCGVPTWGSARARSKPRTELVPAGRMLEARRTDPPAATKREKKGRLMKAVVYDMYGAPDVLRRHPAAGSQGRRAPHQGGEPGLGSRARLSPPRKRRDRCRRYPGQPRPFRRWADSSDTKSGPMRGFRVKRPLIELIRRPTSGDTTHNRVVGGSNPPAATRLLFRFDRRTVGSFHVHVLDDSPCSVVLGPCAGFVYRLAQTDGPDRGQYLDPHIVAVAVGVAEGLGVQLVDEGGGVVPEQ